MVVQILTADVFMRDDDSDKNTIIQRPLWIVPMKDFTDKQGSYLAFIHYYTKINGRPPAEADMQFYFRVTPPTVHQMVLTLAARGLISRVPGQPRSIRLLVAPEDLPPL
jgi:DNA-binding MarR family transcriptional regulator